MKIDDAFISPVICPHHSLHKLTLMTQMNNVKKAFNLEQGGDVRCIIFDNHRPIHLANKYSRDSVAVFDDETEMERESMFMPSSGSEADEPSCSGSSDQDEDDEDDEDDIDEGDEEVGSSELLE